jgi:diguanylate cyclase (GGDEF)-like protein
MSTFSDFLEASPALSPEAGRSRAAPADGQVDLLSGLATRKALIAAMDLALAFPRRPGLRPPLSPSLRPALRPPLRPGLVLLDLDRFKTMNDRLGPAVCDRLLCRVAERLRRAAPEPALIARVSGDGFAVLLADGEQAGLVAARVLDLMGRPFAISGFGINLGASLGIAVADEGTEGALGLLHAADLALHQAQLDGINNVCSFAPAMQTQAKEHQALEFDLRAAMAMQHTELRRALISDQFEIHYQPQMAFADGRLTGFEALIRWRHPVRGLVPPSDFIPLAEEIGLIGLLGEWVMRTACRDAMGWPHAAAGPKLRVAVNVSPLQLREGRALLGSIRRALEEAELPPDRLEVELTESAMADDPGDVLRAIKRLGVHLAMDDFGTGYSSLSGLRAHPFSRVKIDRSFVADLDPNTSPAASQAAARVIRAIAALASGLDMETVVEGIETRFQLEAARAAGCTEMQGFLIARPTPQAGLPPLIEHLSRGLAAHLAT